MERISSHNLPDGQIVVQHFRDDELMWEYVCANAFVARIAGLADNFVDMEFAVNAMNDYVKRGGKHKAQQ